MPIVVKHSGSVAPLLGAAYGGGLGRRYAEQSDDAMRRINARRMAGSRGGGGTTRIRAGGKSAAQEAAEAQGLIGVGPNAARVGRMPVMDDGRGNDGVRRQAPLGRWRQPAGMTREQMAEQVVIEREKRAQQAEIEKENRKAAAEAEIRRQQQEEAARNENPFANRDTSKWDAVKKQKYGQLLRAWQEARKSVTPAEMQELNRQANIRLAELEAIPDQPKPGIKMTGFGEGVEDLPEGEVRVLGDGRIVQNVKGEFKVTDPPKPEKPKEAKPEFSTQDIIAEIKAIEKEESDKKNNEGDRYKVKSREAIKKEALSRLRDALAIKAEIEGAGDAAEDGASKITQKNEDEVLRRWRDQDARAQKLKNESAQVMNDQGLPDEIKDWAARPQNDADFNALPSGAYYVDPEDGKLYQKP